MERIDATWPGAPSWRIRRERHFAKAGGGRVVRCFAERPSDVDTFFRDAVARAGDAEALVDGEERLSYGELDRRVDAVAGNLAGLGVAKGDRIALSLVNRWEFLVLILAAARLGAISVPMNVRMRRPENQYVLAHSGARVLVFEAEGAGEVPDAGETPALAFRFSAGGETAGARPFEDLMAEAPPPPPVEIDEEDTATILYTSGTTGRPKGAMLTHLGIVHSVMHFEASMALGANERTILAVPGSHVTGLVAVLLAMVKVAGCTILMREFKARRFLELAAAERLTAGILVPAMYKLCLMDAEFDAFDLARWRVGGYGGAPMPEATIAELAQRLPGLTLMNAYGATETTSPTTLMPLGRTAGRADSVGHVLPCAEVAVMDDDGREVAPGESGEIWIAGPMVVPGYWDNPAADAESFVGGYWKSGDIGSLDEQGYLRVFDRKKDMINRAGYKVYSVEVENVLSHHPGVVEAAVIGRPDPVLGERVHAFVVTGADTPADADLRQFCESRLSDYKLPESFTFLDRPLPRNANGKVQKAILRDMLDRAR